MLVAIAPSLFIAGLLIQITSSTHQLIQRVTTPALLDTYERLRLHRMSREGKSKFDPYAPDKEGRQQHDLLFDLVIVLNFYEGVCAEVLQRKWTGGVWKNVVYQHVASFIVGARNIMLVWYDEETSGGGETAFPNIRIVAAESERWAKRRKFPILDRIPGSGNESSTNNE